MASFWQKAIMLQSTGRTAAGAWATAVALQQQQQQQ